MERRCPKCNGFIQRIGNGEKPFVCPSCKEHFSEKEVVHQTNADRIRSMTDEELSVFLYGLVNEFGSMNHDCLDFNYCKVHSGEYRYDGWLDWLKQECSDE